MVLKNVILVGIVMFMGYLYYGMSISKSKKMNNYAFFMKIFYLALSFVLAFLNRDFIELGNLAFGGRASVMILIMLEIDDAFINRKIETDLKG